MLQGMESYCIRAFAEALEVIPYTLAENAGLNPIEMVTELRNKHARGETSAGINVRKGQVTNMMEENVVQPLLVTTSAITLACECVRMILKVCVTQVSNMSIKLPSNCTGKHNNCLLCYATRLLDASKSITLFETMLLSVPHVRHVTVGFKDPCVIDPCVTDLRLACRLMTLFPPGDSGMASHLPTDCLAFEQLIQSDIQLTEAHSSSISCQQFACQQTLM